MARTQTRRKAAAKKSARRKTPVKAAVKRKAAVKVAAKKAAPARKTAPARKSAPPKVARKAAPKAARAPRVVAADGQVVKPAKSPSKRALDAQLQERRLSLAAQLHDKEPERDTSMIIVDYHQLRTEAIRAMGGDIESADASDLVEVEGVMVVRGSFATEAKGQAVVKKIREQKKGAGTVFNVHPLDFHILTGDQRINTRDFSTPAMIKRVAELTYDIAANGVQLELKAFQRNDLLYGMSGETRWRATAHAHVLKSRGLVEDAPPSIPVILIAKGKDDAFIQLDVIKQNMVFPQPPLEIAEGIAKSFHLGNTVEKIATYMNETKAWVEGRIAIMGMPARVKNMIREGEVTIPFAWRVWEEEKQDPDQTVATLEFAVRTAKAQGSTRAMPRHLPPKADAPRKTTARAPAPAEATNDTSTTTDEVAAFGTALREGMETGAASAVGVDTVTDPGASTVTVDASAMEKLAARLQEVEAELDLFKQQDAKKDAIIAEKDAKIAAVTKERDQANKRADESKAKEQEATARADKSDAAQARLTKHFDNIAGVLANCPLKNPEDGTVGMFPSLENFINPVASTLGIDVPEWAKPEEEEAA